MTGLKGVTAGARGLTAIPLPQGASHRSLQSEDQPLDEDCAGPQTDESESPQIGLA